MSNNIYNILNNFNKVAQEAKPVVNEQKAATQKTKLEESMEQISEKYMGFKKTAAAIKKGGSAENPEAVAAAIGRKKYGKEKFQQAAAAGKKLGEQQGVAEEAKPDYIDLDKDGNKTEPMKKAAKDAKQKKVDEVAPPGAKAERMVKHIKKGYAKDGKLSPKEKSIAYATAWKAHNKGKLDETIKSLIDAGFTKDQIVEGWEEMMKAVQKHGAEEKGTGKFDKKKISTGTVYTRKYDPKSGETDDTGKDGEGQVAKRGRGRPKKHTFESFSTANKMIAEAFKSLVEGRIEGGVWVDKPGNVPVPQNPEVARPTPKAAPATTVTPKTIPASGVKEEEDEEMEEGNAFGAAVAKAKADGIQPGEKIKVGGKEYPVKEGSELEAMLKLAGIKEAKEEDEGDEEEDSEEEQVDESTKLDECGAMGMGYGDMQNQEGKMKISTNMSSDGNKSVTITADGDAAAELLQMLKLAGMEGHAHSDQPAALVVTDEPEEEMEEAKDERYHASTTPDEQVAPVQAQTKGGDGDVAGQEKTMRKHGYQFGDNNLAMREVATEGIQDLDTMGRKLMKEYESIKVKK